MKSLLLVLAAALAVLAGPVLAPPAPRPGATAGEPVLIELFTSQGCSSCPPADHLAARLAREAGLVVVSRPVTYWHRLGWKDTLALAENTRLQRAYAASGLAGRNGVYTPQAVIAGSAGLVGADEAGIRAQLAAARQRQGAALRVRRLADGGYAVGIAGRAPQPAELVLLAVTRRAEVAIGRGENGGRAVAYANVLRAETRLGAWWGGRRAVTIAPRQLAAAGADRHALVLRVPDGGAVLAATWLS